MITDKQFNDAFTAAGGCFFLTQFELIKSWYGEREELVDLIYEKSLMLKRPAVTPESPAPFVLSKKVE